MELYIDNKKVDMDASTEVSVSLSAAATGDPRKGRAGYTRRVRLPMTPANDAVFGYAAEILSRDRFNAVRHTGRVEHDGAVLIEGSLFLSRAERSPDGGFYEVHIIGASKVWAGIASARRLHETGIDFSKTLSAVTISSSWTDNSPVRFLPVAREKMERDFSSGSVIPAAKVLSSDDYHPFLHAATLLRAVFADAGYRVESDFVDGELFSSLYISGNYPTRDVSTVKANMDFLARRLAASSDVANSMGRVYADPYRASFTVGNIVDTADPSQVVGGVSYDDVFTRNGCFQMDDDRIAFVPTSPVSVGFQFHLRYTTDYRMKNRNEMAGFDTVYLGEQDEREFTLANPYPDRRSTFRAGYSYKLGVFDHVAGREYQLRYTQGNGTVSSAVVGARFSSLSIASTTQAVSNPVLYYRTSSAGSWMVYGGDWALYDGFVGETGTLDVELTVRTAPEEITPGRPKFFNSIYFAGADPGMRLTVSPATWLRPVFYAQPTEGAALRFADVCAHDATQMDFINAVRQMFNLRFHTDSRAKTVRIEPADSFYSDARIVDWTERLDLGKPIAVEELGGDLSRRMVWCYKAGDGAVGRFNRTSGEDMGSWSASVENAAAANGTSVWENALFTPSINAPDLYTGARAALLVQAGDTSIDTLDRTEDLNFAPKVVRYEGMVPLPAGQAWGWPSPYAIQHTYPKLAFHAPESGYTLCFEDRDGCTGLHSMWEGDVRLWNEGRRVTLHLALDAADIEALSFPAGDNAGFRTLYRLSTGGESALYRLEEVCDYSPSAPSTKCVFIKHIPQP